MWSSFSIKNYVNPAPVVSIIGQKARKCSLVSNFLVSVLKLTNLIKYKSTCETSGVQSSIIEKYVLNIFKVKC